MISNSTIITHGDVDGMVCAAQLIRREKLNCDLSFSNAKYIKSTLARILRSSQRPPRIYISDIPANSDVVKVMSVLLENGTEIFWIDHHPWEPGVKEQIEKYCKKVVYNESLQTPAGILMARWLKDEDPYYDQIGKICYAYEKGTEWERNWFRLLSSYIGNSDRDVLERLAFNRDFTEGDMQRIEQKKNDEQEAEKILNDTTQTMATQSDKSLAVYDTSKNKGIYLGHKVFEYHDVDYCLIRISETKWQLACNPSKKYSMRHIMGDQNIGDQTFTFAGRENELLAIEMSGNRVHFDSHRQIINWLCNRL
ncbi:MAG: hypothetical protein ACYC54_00130 [Sedimentisphaerales bacterium]